MARVCHSQTFILGPEVAAFESEFSTWLGAPHAVGTASGTDALELMLRTLQLPTGSSVAVPSFAPSAVAAAVLRAGCELHLVDVEADTLTLCPAALSQTLRSAAGSSIRAVLAVHLYGHPADIQALAAVCAEHEVCLLEDCAQAHGATLSGRKVGTLTRMAAFSFYPTKTLAAAGDAGAVICQHSADAEQLRSLREYGWSQRYNSQAVGINSRLDELQAAILRVRLTHLDQQLAQRSSLASIYSQRITLPERAGCCHGWHLCVIQNSQRDALRSALAAQGIPTMIHYPAALHQQAAYAHAQHSPLPISTLASSRVMSLPLHEGMQPEDVIRVTEAIHLETQLQRS